jgi:F0F1-type ATP synthase epsilon subunit
MQVSILEPKKIVWEGQAKEVRLPAEGGELCVLDFHQPFLIRLRKGVVRSEKVRTAIKDGIAFLRSNKLILFVEI